MATPIVVEGELWGAMLVASTDERLPRDTEERLENFTELVATAVANAESRAELDASPSTSRVRRRPGVFAKRLVFAAVGSGEVVGEVPGTPARPAPGG